MKKPQMNEAFSKPFDRECRCGYICGADTNMDIGYHETPHIQTAEQRLSVKKNVRLLFVAARMRVNLSC